MAETGADRALRILHLEDSPPDAEIIREALMDAGFLLALDWALSEQEFAWFLQHREYDLVLADYVVPSFGVLPALVLAKSYCPDTPFICVSGAIGEEQAVDLLKRGVTDFVRKDHLIRLPMAIERALNEAAEHKACRLAETALHRLNRELRAVSTCSQLLVRAEDELTLLHDICRVICDEAGYRMAWVGYAENDEEKSVRPVAWAGFENGYVANARLSWSDDTVRGRGPGGTAIRSGETTYVQDFATSGQTMPWREPALERGYRSTIGLPLKDENGRAFGVLLIYSSEITAFTSAEVRLLEELAGDLAFGIMVLRARTDRRRAADVQGARIRLIEFAPSHSIEDLLQKGLAEVEAVTESKASFFHSVGSDQAPVCVDCVREGRPVVHNQGAGLSVWKGVLQCDIPVTRELLVPVVRGSRVVAVVGVGNKESDYDSQDVETVSLLSDLTWEIVERKRAEELAKFAQRLENERIGRELHDGLGGHLTGIGYLLGSAAHDARSRQQPELSDAIGQCSKLLKEATRYVRDLARGLAVENSTKEALIAEMQSLVGSLQAFFGVDCITSIDSEFDPPDGQTISHLIQIIREAVNNAVRHGHPKRIWITLSPSGMAIENDGETFREEQSDHESGENGGVGLQSMHQRARIIGAQLEIGPRAEGGSFCRVLFGKLCRAEKMMV